MTPAARVRDALIVSGRDLEVLAYAVHTARRTRRLEGHPAHPDLERLAHTFEPAVSASVSPRPHADTTAEPARHDEHMTTSEAAELLGVTPRTVRRMAAKLSGRNVGGRWLVSARAVREHLAGRTGQQLTEGTPHVRQ